MGKDMAVRGVGHSGTNRKSQISISAAQGEAFFQLSNFGEYFVFLHSSRANTPHLPPPPPQYIFQLFSKTETN